MFAWSHAATAAAAPGPGATGEAKRLPGARATRWVESSEARSAPARSRPPATAVVLCDAQRDAHEPALERGRAIRARPFDGVERERHRQVLAVSASSASGPSSIRRSTPWWRSPLGSRKRDEAADRRVRRGRLEHELHPRVVVRVRPRRAA